MTTRSVIAAVGLSVAMVLAACGGDSSGSEQDSGERSSDSSGAPSSETSAESTTTEPTPPNPDLPSLQGDLADFVERWNTLNVTVSEQYERPATPIGLDSFSFGPGPAGQEVFVMQVSDSAVLGGMRDVDSGQLTTLLVSADPDGPSTAVVVLTAMVAVSTGEVMNTDLSDHYRAVALDPRPDNLTYTTVGPVDWVAYGVPGATADDPLVTLVAAPVTDQETASLTAVTTQQAVLGLLAGSG